MCEELTSIIFVDDEPEVLTGLRRMLRPRRHEWQMQFAGSGQEAIDFMAQTPVDIIVSDMRMPGVDGAQLLRHVAAEHPGVVRIVLSGHVNEEMVLKSVGPSHQYLAKPCDAEALQAVLTRACALRSLMRDPALAKLISQLESLPPIPDIYRQLTQLLQRDDASLAEIAELIGTDMGLVAKLLQLVNSAYFGIQRHVQNLRDAIAFLGINTIKSVVLGMQFFSGSGESRIKNFSMESLFLHSVEVGSIAEKITREIDDNPTAAGNAMLAGMLHDTGKLVLATQVPDIYEHVCGRLHDEQIPAWQAELDVLHTTHSEVGAYLMGLWGLPESIVDALAFHHAPANCPHADFTPVVAVHIANAVVKLPSIGRDAVLEHHLDTAYLKKLGLLEQTNAWLDAFSEETRRDG